MTNKSATSPLRGYWLAELIRLREEHWGPLEDADALRQIRNTPGALPQRIIQRAVILARQERLEPLLDAWRRGAYAALLGLLALALLSGISLALGALGDSARHINILWALGALLGLHLLTLLAWLLSLLLPARSATGLGQLWLWITRKLARGPDAALAPQALLNLLARGGALRWLLGCVSHLLWLAALCAALATLLILLSTASYRFVWATTLLTPDTFVAITRTLGWLPAQFGFSPPDAAMVRASDGLQDLPAATQLRWSVWLLGSLVLYGLVPRLLAGLFCMLMAVRALRRLRINPALPGFAALRDRLEPGSESTGIDRPDCAAPTPNPAVATPHSISGQAVLAGLELPSDMAWPPPQLPAAIHHAGNLDTREERNRLLDALTQAPAARLLIACDARQTPDRGAIALIRALAAQASQTRVWLCLPAAAAHSRDASWRTLLGQAGLAPPAIMSNADQPLQWLAADHD